MARGRNSKSSILKDNARERRIRHEAAMHLDLAANVIKQWFTGDDEMINRLAYLSQKIMEGQVDYTDHIP